MNRTRLFFKNKKLEIIDLVNVYKKHPIFWSLYCITWWIIGSASLYFFGDIVAIILGIGLVLFIIVAIIVNIRMAINGKTYEPENQEE